MGSRLNGLTISSIKWGCKFYREEYGNVQSFQVKIREFIVDCSKYENGSVTINAGNIDSLMTYVYQKEFTHMPALNRCKYRRELEKHILYLIKEALNVDLEVKPIRLRRRGKH
jgi:hypothetical protein